MFPTPKWAIFPIRRLPPFALDSGFPLFSINTHANYSALSSPENQLNFHACLWAAQRSTEQAVLPSTVGSIILQDLNS